MATIAVENYLKHVLLLSDGSDDLVSMGALAGALEVVPGTVTTMVKALADAGLVEHQPRLGVRLTHDGRRVALNVLRKHRLVETFLVQVLKMDWSKVHAEAEQLEHAISDEVLDRLDALLGHPVTDPHGDPIPNRQGKLSAQVYATLSTCLTGRPLRIVRITEQSPEFLQFAEQNGLRPGTALQVTERNLTAGLVTLRRAKGKPVALSIVAAGKVLVELDK
ncbi:metal-dependent transcriptional regulator [Horticoccus sp. 23ND18S-11]|uniref:metal-dependent transcriptional regulator n=1 Tax=Horticoccus sp. 23ND18S-11 TaxID=3391832 RepID=UPI0039C9B235